MTTGTLAWKSASRSTKRAGGKTSRSITTQVSTTTHERPADLFACKRMSLGALTAHREALPDPQQDIRLMHLLNRFRAKAFTQHERNTKMTHECGEPCETQQSQDKSRLNGSVHHKRHPKHTKIRHNGTGAPYRATHVNGIHDVNVDVRVLESKLGARRSIHSELYFYNTPEGEKESTGESWRN